jgi:cyclohexanone monooxygenase
MSQTVDTPAGSGPGGACQFDAIIVGAGFAGLYMLHRLRGMGLNARVLERGSGIGGTWYWNRYPGARCDIESMEYSYQFSDELQQEWDWSERYATQPEILRYIEHVADRFDLRRDIQLNACVERAAYDAPGRCWQIDTRHGESFSARFCIMATGCLSSTNLPDFKGLDEFLGDWYHTGDWPQQGRGFQRAARGRDRHRLFGGPVDTADCRTGGASARIPAHPELLGAGAQPRCSSPASCSG